MFSLFIIILFFQIIAVDSYLSPVQLSYIHKILTHPNTPLDIRNKTKEILFTEYYAWLKKQVRQFSESNYYSRNPVTTDELYQYASKGLLRAIDNFDGKRSLAQYAEKYVIGEMHTGLLELIPLRPMNKYQKYIKKEKVLNPTILPPENYWIFDKCREYTDRNKDPVSVNGYLRDGGQCFCQESETVYNIKSIVLELSEEEQKIFFSRYDFETLGTKHTIDELCEILEISHETYRRRMNIIKKYIKMRLESSLV